MRRTSSSPEISVLLFVDSMNIDGVVSVYDYLGCSECGDKIRASLLNKPVNELVVMSRSFGSKLRAELLEEGNLKGIDIRLPDEILWNNSK